MEDKTQDITSKAADAGSQQSYNNADVEKQTAPETQELQRKLNSRHLQFVAIGMFHCAGA